MLGNIEKFFPKAILEIKAKPTPNRKITFNAPPQDSKGCANLKSKPPIINEGRLIITELIEPSCLAGCLKTIKTPTEIFRIELPIRTIVSSAKE